MKVVGPSPSGCAASRAGQPAEHPQEQQQAGQPLEQHSQQAWQPQEQHGQQAEHMQEGQLPGSYYRSRARVVLLGHGADELCGG